MNTFLKKPTLLVAGATGFIGQRLLVALKDYKIIALQRFQNAPQALHDATNIEWRKCDLFSLLQIEEACRDANIAIYLVHSMMPSARLTQGSFSDTDLILADNFVRACKKNNIQRILYLGGIIPDEKRLSPHLQSRLEVEKTLRDGGLPFTSLRAGLIIGAGGSSFEMMYLLVKRLPLMICPHWTKHSLRPIDVHDVIASLKYCLENPGTQSKTYDLAGPETISYQKLMVKTAEILEKRRWILPVSFLNPKFSVIWIALITGASPTLIKPLVESLRNNLLPIPQQLLTIPNYAYKSIDESLKEEMKDLKPCLSSTHKTIRERSREASLVRSVQRLHLPQAKNAAWAAKEYLRWLPHFLFPFLIVEIDDTSLCRFKIFFLRKSLLRLKLSTTRSTPDRQLFYIVGGLLASRQNPKDARLEFRTVLGGQYILAAIHNFSPRLPWYIYKYTQGIVHVWIMKSFDHYLQNRSFQKNHCAARK
jgi:uncharacterized protein YbjT (DUF2867 family)